MSEPIPTPERVPHPVEEQLGHRFASPSLLAEALTHASFRNEASEGAADYERLEFLGDAVVELAVSELLYRRLPDAREGRLTQLRARLVNARTLAAVAQRLDLGPHIRMGRGESQSGGRARRSILSDVFEALIGAVYVDGGFGAALGVVERLFAARLEETLARASVSDAKSLLQEWAQRELRATPTYAVVEVSGPQHEACFVVAVSVGEALRVEGRGGSKKDAEQQAAAAALRSVGAVAGEALTPG